MATLKYRPSLFKFNKKFRRIEITSMDLNLSERLCLNLQRRLEGAGFKTKYICNQDSMLALALGILKGYPAIPLHTQTKFLLDTAREYQNQIENLKDLRHHPEIIVISSTSFWMTVAEKIYRKTSMIGRLLAKEILEKMVVIPSSMYYIKKNINDVLADRKWHNDHTAGRVVEFNLRYGGAYKLEARYLKSLAKMGSQNAVNCVIIPIDNRSEDSVALEIFEDIKNKKILEGGYRCLIDKQDEQNSSGGLESTTLEDLSLRDIRLLTLEQTGLENLEPEEKQKRIKLNQLKIDLFRSKAQSKRLREEIELLKVDNREKQ